MALSPDFLYELHRLNDVAEVIGRDVQLKKRGRTYSGLCPFHSEKTPSFVVYPETQSFYCFGCGKGGDIITYVKLRDNLEYMEAVRTLAQNVGLQMPSELDDKQAKSKVNMLAANKFAARFFYDSLNSPAGAGARAYLRARGLSDNTIKRFGVGFAPPEWQALTDSLHDNGFFGDDLIEAGLCGRNKNGKLYDRFRNRVMFPIIDLRGNVVGFGGRRLDDQDNPKYINTNDTAVYKKSRVLYAMNIAKADKTRSIIIVEGYMDAVALHQAGFMNVVAACGTALTEEHARLLSQYADEVVLCFDSDDAGRIATSRAMGVLKNTGLLVRVLDVPGAKDPDEFIKEKGVVAFGELLKNSDTSTEYELSRVRKALDMNTDAGRVEYLKKAALLLAGKNNATEVEIYASRVAGETGVSKTAVLQQVESERKKLLRREDKQTQTSLIGNISRDYKELKQNASEGGMGAMFAKYQLIAVLCRNPDYCGAVLDIIKPSELADAELERALTRICELSAAGSFYGFSSISGELTQATGSMLARFLAKNEGANCTEQDARFLAQRIKRAPPDPKKLEELSDEEIMKLINDNNTGR